MTPNNDFISEICILKHSCIDKDISEIKADVNIIKKEKRDQHEEIKDLIRNLSQEANNSHQNLKNKIILVNKSMGDKIDELNNFDKILRGNGTPGVWEAIRSIKKNIKSILWAFRAVLVIIFICGILVLGGSYKGISIKSVQKKFGWGKKEIKTVEVIPKTTPKVIPKTTPEVIPEVIPKVIPKVIPETTPKIISKK